MFLACRGFPAVIKRGKNASKRVREDGAGFRQTCIALARATRAGTQGLSGIPTAFTGSSGSHISKLRGRVDASAAGGGLSEVLHLDVGKKSSYGNWGNLHKIGAKCPLLEAGLRGISSVPSPSLNLGRLAMPPSKRRAPPGGSGATSKNIAAVNSDKPKDSHSPHISQGCQPLRQLGPGERAADLNQIDAYREGQRR